jgi:hypothetical protein
MPDGSGNRIPTKWNPNKIPTYVEPIGDTPITATSLPLPTGAATSSKQDTQTTLLQGIAGLLPTAYDYITYTSGSTTDTYVFKTGGSGGSTVKTITITFVDSTKKVLSTVGAT